MDRRLSAILAADVVGYSALMERDEAGTFDQLRAHRRELFEPEIKKHRGRIFKLMGDGLLAEFGSVVDAVECAAAIQRNMQERNSAIEKGKRIQVRIGINLGEVIVEGKDRHGEGVNIAARLQQLAEPGGICVSGKVAKEIEKKLSFGFEPMGQQRVKNIAEPIAVYRVKLDGLPQHRTLGLKAVPALKALIPFAAILIIAIGIAAWLLHRPTPLAHTGPPTVAVLPFNNMSGDPSLQYFADGTTETVIASLSRSPHIKVVARTSSDAYKGKALDVRQIGKDLGARYVLEGSVQKGAEKMRVIAQLIDSNNGNHVWAQRYDRESNDALALQDDVAEQILRSLAGEQGLIKKQEYEQAWGKESSELGEWDYYLRGHDLFNHDDAENTERAIQIWTEGLQHYPNSGFLRIKLGWGYYARYYFGVSKNAQEDLRRAFEFAKEGLADKNLPPLGRTVGHALMAALSVDYKHDVDAAMRERDIVLRMAPNDFSYVAGLANIPIMAGKPDVTIEALASITPQDQNSYWGYSYLGWAYFAKGEYTKAIESIKQATQVVPTYSLPFLAASYVALGKEDEARATIAKLREAVPDASLKMFQNLHYTRDQEVLDREMAALRKAGLPEG